MELSKITRKNSKNPIPVIGIESKQVLNVDDKVSRIAVSAYYKAEARGYAPGHEIQDWLEAEAELHK
jgi:hypothetical protein